MGSLLNYLLVAAALASGYLYSAFRTPKVAGVPLSAAALVLLPLGIWLTLLEKYR